MAKNTELVEAIFTLSRLMKEDMSFDSNLATLSVLQIQTLVFLKKNPQAQMNQVATAFSIELPSATSLITKLTKAKLVVRSIDKKDRRCVLISLTEKGTSLLSDAMKQRSEKLADNLSFLPEKDKNDLLRIVAMLIKNMEKKSEK